MNETQAFVKWTWPITGGQRWVNYCPLCQKDYQFAYFYSWKSAYEDIVMHITAGNHYTDESEEM